MLRHHKPDPYDGFKNDVERRRALNMRVISKTVTTVGVALASSSIPFKETLFWLKTLFL